MIVFRRISWMRERECRANRSLGSPATIGIAGIVDVGH